MAETLFKRMEEEMPGYVAAAVGTLEPGGSFASHVAGDLDLAEVRDPLVRMLTSYSELYRGLGGALDFGSGDELLISASRAYLLVKVAHDRKRFVAVLLSSNGNIGYLRFRMREYLRMALNG